MSDAIEVLKQQGATIVDPADIPSIVDTDPQNNFLKWGTCAGPADVRGKDANCSIEPEIRHEARLQRVARVARAGRAGEDARRSPRVQSSRTPHRNAIKYGQAQLDVSDEVDVERDRAQVGGRSQEGHPPGRHARHQGSDRDAQARRAASSPARAAQASPPSPGYPTVIVPFATGAERAHECAVPGGLQREARALRRELHRRGVQRAAADRARLRVRTGDEESVPPPSRRERRNAKLRNAK